MPDKAHAANAKARATQQVKKGNISASTAAHIRAMANKKLGKKNDSGERGGFHAASGAGEHFEIPGGDACNNAAVAPDGIHAGVFFGKPSTREDVTPKPPNNKRALREFT